MKTKIFRLLGNAFDLVAGLVIGLLIWSAIWWLIFLLNAGFEKLHHVLSGGYY